MPRGLRAGRAPISGVALVLALILSLLTSAPAHAAGGTLHGVLTNPDGTPREYFRVDLYRSDGGGAWALALSRTVTSWDSGRPVGEFDLAGIPVGSYRACFTALGFESVDTTGRSCWRGAYDVFGATDLTITEGGTTTIAPRLPRESSIRGRVVSPEGAGVYAYVQAFRRAPDGTWSEYVGHEAAQNGTFTIPDVDPGTYRVCLSDVQREFFRECWEDAATLEEADEVVVPPGGSPTFRFTLARRGTVTGTVTRPAGSTEPLYVGIARFRNNRWESIDYGAVGADGRYRIAGLDADTYRLCLSGYDVVTSCWQQGDDFTEATDLPLATGEARTGIDFSPGPAGFVTGTLPEMYLGAQGYPVPVAYRQVGGAWEATSVGEAWPTGLGSDWEYRLGQLPTGRYVICVHHEDPEFVPAFPQTCTGHSPTPQGGEPVDVVAGQTTSGVDIATDRAGEIRGQVTGTSTSVRVDLYTGSGRLATSRTTDAEGYYRFRELPDGSYYVAFHRETATSPVAAEWWRNKTDGVGLAGATAVTVDGDIITGIRAVLDTGGAITGRLLDASSAPVAGCRMQARARDGSLAARTGTTAADGTFSVGGLSTASYVLVVPAACTGGAARYYDAAAPGRTVALLRDADAVAVTLGGTTALPGDLRLP